MLRSNARAEAYDASIALKVINQHKHLAGAMLPILHALQAEFGYVDKQTVPLIAEALNVSKAEVHGVISFYHDFKTKPQGAHVIKLCLAEACQSMGCDGIKAHVLRKHSLEMGGTTADGKLTIEAVYCLGNCSLAPAALVGDALVGRLTAARLDTLVEALGVKPAGAHHAH